MVILQSPIIYLLNTLTEVLFSTLDWAISNILFYVPYLHMLSVFH